ELTVTRQNPHCRPGHSKTTTLPNGATHSQCSPRWFRHTSRLSALGPMVFPLALAASSGDSVTVLPQSSQPEAVRAHRKLRLKTTPLDNQAHDTDPEAHGLYPS